eukprot:2020258-Amphidinium_carterae.1
MKFYNRAGTILTDAWDFLELGMANHAGSSLLYLPTLPAATVGMNCEEQLYTAATAPTIHLWLSRPELAVIGKGVAPLAHSFVRFRSFPRAQHPFSSFAILPRALAETRFSQN